MSDNIQTTPIDIETDIRLAILNEYKDKKDNELFVNAYERALVDAFDQWFSRGMKGSVMPIAHHIMVERGVIQ